MFLPSAGCFKTIAPPLTASNPSERSGPRFLAGDAVPYWLVFFTGGAALSRQVLWQLDVSTALGVSAQAAAFTIVIVMGGLACGALAGGMLCQRLIRQRPWRSLGLVEMAAASLAWLPSLVESPNYALLTLAMLPCCIMMGMTLPLMGQIAQSHSLPLSRLYGANTLGAAVGSWLVVLILLPRLGHSHSALCITLVQLAAAALCLAMPTRQPPPAPSKPSKQQATSLLPARLALGLCALTGAATMMLEVAWFRLLRAAWLATSDSFAVMLGCVLLGLAAGAFLASRLRRVIDILPLILILAGLSVLASTPLIERLDLWSDAGGSHTTRHIWRSVSALILIGPSVCLLGIVLPALLDAARDSFDWALRYAINALAAVLGGILAGWFLLAYLGPVRTAWATAIVLGLVGLFLTRKNRWSPLWAAILAAAAFGSWSADSGIGRSRVQGPTALLRQPHQVVAHANGPDVTTSVMQTPQGQRVLFIDGYGASAEAGRLTEYMHAMGRLPMRLHGSAKQALVICFGTGQTVRALVNEQPEAVTVVDVNPAVFQLAHHFISNQQVLQDPRVTHWVDDGRAWLRRSGPNYDVITLEPMPPFFAGSNALYSEEFYSLAAARLNPGGCMAQWFPVHLLTPQQARSVAAAFIRVFPGAVLWSDPQSADRYGYRQQLILLGRKAIPTQLNDPNLVLDAAALANYAANAEPVTDDNQLLSFGTDGLHYQNLSQRNVTAENWAELNAHRPQPPAVPTAPTPLQSR